MFKKLALVAALCSLVATQATFAAAKPATPPTNIEISMTQQEMAVDVPDTGGAVAAGVGGLFGALIGAAINAAAVSNAEKRVGEMRNQLVDYHFNDHVEQALRRKFDAAGIAPMPAIEYLHTVRGHDELVAANAQNRTGLLFMSPRYAITSNFENVSVSINTITLDRSLKSNGKVKERFRSIRNYTYSFPMQKISGSGATEDAARWVGLGSAELSAMLDEGIDQVTDMVVHDLTPEGFADANAKIPRAGRTVTLASGRSFNRTRFGVVASHPIDGVAKPFSERAAMQAAAATAAAPMAPVATDVAPAAAPAAANDMAAAAAPATDTAVETAAAPTAVEATTTEAAAAPATEAVAVPEGSQ